MNIAKKTAEALALWRSDRGEETYLSVIRALRDDLIAGCEMVIPVSVENGHAYLESVQDEDGRWLSAAFPDGAPTGDRRTAVLPLDRLLRAAQEEDTDGLCLDPLGTPFIIPKKYLAVLLGAAAREV